MSPITVHETCWVLYKKVLPLELSLPFVLQRSNFVLKRLVSFQTLNSPTMTTTKMKMRTRKLPRTSDIPTKMTSILSDQDLTAKRFQSQKLYSSFVLIKVDFDELTVRKRYDNLMHYYHYWSILHSICIKRPQLFFSLLELWQVQWPNLAKVTKATQEST